jgi:hypothetical protein
MMDTAGFHKRPPSAVAAHENNPRHEAEVALRILGSDKEGLAVASRHCNSSQLRLAGEARYIGLGNRLLGSHQLDHTTAGRCILSLLPERCMRVEVGDIRIPENLVAWASVPR